MTLTVASVLAAGGKVSQRLPHYEVRPQQLEMAEAVEKAIAANEHLVVEAGTGTGKSFAYLVPAILAATAGQGERPSADPDDDEPGGKKSKSKKSAAGQRRKVIISTHTISLQEQLIKQDIPFLNAVLPVEFSAVLAKGRSNYLSLRRLKVAGERAMSWIADPQDQQQFDRLVDWARDTTDGSLSDLEFRPQSRVWDEVQSEHGNCLAKKCPTYDSCFHYKARRRVWNADVLVVNHALFFSDLALRREGVSILPDYDVVVFDEAHTIEQVASDHLGLGITNGQVEYLLNKLYNDRTQKGLFVNERHLGLQKGVDGCRHAARDLFQDVRTWLATEGDKNGRVRQPLEIDNQASIMLADLARRTEMAANLIPNEELKIEFTSAAERCNRLAELIATWVTQATEESVYWIEVSGQRQERTMLASAPVEVGPVLQAELFNKVPSVILTSATLAVAGQGFEFVKKRLGLTKSTGVQLGSPFDYKRQVQLVLVEGMPDPNLQPMDYESAVCEKIKEYVLRTQGRAFVLFTSYKMLSNCARRLTPWFVTQNMGLYAQGGELSRTQMLEKFKADKAGVLFGADSFWQGVDVPGDALQNVIITKLPFSVPDHPLLEARVELIKGRGGKPFFEYQIPEAVIKLKQGFGRLIRRATDHGMVVILDPRVRTKSYGEVFLQSLPDCRLVVE